MLAHLKIVGIADIVDIVDFVDNIDIVDIVDVVNIAHTKYWYCCVNLKHESWWIPRLCAISKTLLTHLISNTGLRDACASKKSWRFTLMTCMHLLYWKLLKRSVHILQFLISIWHQFMEREGRSRLHLNWWIYLLLVHWKSSSVTFVERLSLAKLLKVLWDTTWSWLMISACMLSDNIFLRDRALDRLLYSLSSILLDIVFNKLSKLKTLSLTSWAFGNW